MSILKTSQPFLFGLALLVAVFGLIPTNQDPGQQATPFAGTVITTTAQTAVTPCGQGNGAIGRKTLVVENETGGGAITVTAELRTTRTESNFSSGYLAVNGLAAGSLSSATSAATAAAGAFCQLSAVSATTSTITVTLRRE